MFNKIVVPLDGSEAAETALESAMGLARLYGSQLLLVRVRSMALSTGFPGGFPLPEGTLENERRACEDYLSDVRQRVETAGFPCSTHVPVGEPAATIMGLAEEQNADLIVINSHGRTGMKRVLLGSVAERLARHVHCPVLIVGRKAVKAGTG